MFRLNSLAVIAGLMLTEMAHGQGYTPVRPVRTLDDWQCMSLASVYGRLGTNAPPVPEYASSESSAPKIGVGAGVIIVPKALRPTNGRVEVLRPNGKKAWIAADQLVPWRSLSDARAVCRPVLLSNGRYGFATSG